MWVTEEMDFLQNLYGCVDEQENAKMYLAVETGISFLCVSLFLLFGFCVL